MQDRAPDARPPRPGAELLAVWLLRVALRVPAAWISVRLYDPFFGPDAAVWDRRYDFIAALEVLEHFCDPATELDWLFAVLEPGGWLGVMTRGVGDPERFEESRYTRDFPTPLLLPPENDAVDRGTLGASVSLPGPDVALFRRAAVW